METFSLEISAVKTTTHPDKVHYKVKNYIASSNLIHNAEESMFILKH